MPFAPLDIPMGRVCEFCIYHLMPVDNPTALFHISAEIIQHTSDEESPELVIPAYAPKGQPATNAKPKNSLPRPTILSPPAPKGMRYLGEFASVIRSKNAGPYELTFDIMFDSLEKFLFAKSSGVLDDTKFAALYDIDISDIVAAVWWEPAMALKVTVKRPIVSGRFGETDTHGSCQHARLLRVLIPIEDDAADE